MKKSVLLGVVCVVFIGLGGTVYAYGDGGGECAAKKERKVRAKVGHVMKKIDVTDQQRLAIEDELDNAIASWLELRGATRAVPRELLAQWRTEQPDREVMIRLIDERIEALRAAAHETIDSAIAVHQTLEPEQREKVSQLISKRMKRRGFQPGR